ncbi:iron-siderophore ABC transporter substrate-binding protein [Modestobacter sp. VKM Ac-2979]|uniref:iron-siderophore ABC transporter substrate-binding protein n=1 Tax=unclassified Modestobacter TaxID=2643866 RepID=UPI0022ABB994|nr:MULTISPECIES: iron-siderophore ABC transporter substrate-binding protein [unclassified Modestobacter]MCZ2811116.1 iron-siderophore ABC transporter substrate-binding protein [Modestobacter sp. VKM Ac-2979]MCZ2840629.1 iron-siderophore ABC transporter substrate-binding protein [Modestobacter sp. VKM Ac-2980]
MSRLPLRRRAVRGTALLAAALVLTSCGGSDSSDDTAAEGTDPATGSSDAFPVTVETAFGDVTVEEEPTRVVALGWGDAEMALALGVQPVGASDWLGFGGEGVGPWAEGLYDEAPEIIETLEPSLEAIAALDPDLILDTKSPATEERYEALSAIAPTISQPVGTDPYVVPFEDQLDLVGQALGKTEEAEEVEAEVDEAFAAAAEAHPEFDGTEVAVAAYTAEGFGAYVSGDARVDFMEQLGFVNEPAIEELATDSFYVPVSEEQLPLLDSDLTVAFPIFVEASEITDNPLWQAIPSVQAGNAVVLDDETLTNAFSIGTPQGIQYALDNAVPQFADALG